MRNALGLCCLALVACSPTSTKISRESLLDDAETAIPVFSAHEDFGFGYTSRPGNGDDEFDLDFSLKPDGKLEFRICRPQGVGQYDLEEFACPVLQNGEMVLSAIAEKELRALLLLSRPAKLSEDGPFLIPRGCDFVMHGSRVYSVIFSDEKKFGAFMVQQRTDCEGMDDARAYIRAILRILPDQSLMGKYPIYWPAAN